MKKISFISGEIMLNWIWGMMIFLGTIYGIFSGNTEALSLAAMDGANEAVSLGIQIEKQTRNNINRVTRC